MHDLYILVWVINFVAPMVLLQLEMLPLKLIDCASVVWVMTLEDICRV